MAYAIAAEATAAETYATARAARVDALKAALTERINTKGQMPHAIGQTALDNDMARILAIGGAKAITQTPSPIVKNFRDRLERSVIVPFGGNKGQFVAGGHLLTDWEAAVTASAALNPAIDMGAVFCG